MNMITYEFEVLRLGGALILACYTDLRNGLTPNSVFEEI